MRLIIVLLTSILMLACGSDSWNYDYHSDSDYPLASGYWRLDYARTIADNCFDDAPGNRPDVVDYLPQGFTIQATTNSFLIEAIDYGTDGPVSCPLTGAQFTCSPQRASTLTWTYQIVFSGNLRSYEVIQGQAFVRYLEADSYNQELFDEQGFDLEQCSSTILMELVWSDW